MAIPTTGPVSMGMIRNELGMPTATNFSLTNASVGGVAGYPTLNPFSSPLIPNTFTPYSMSEWRGYSSTTIYWSNNFGGFGVSNLKIYVNGTLVLNNTNSLGTGASGTLVINNGDTFYATLTPITYSPTFFGPPIATINTYRLLSPFSGPLGPPSTFLNQTTNSTFPPFPFSSPSQTATIQAVNLGVYEITAFT
jgi:hypothetical protein